MKNKTKKNNNTVQVSNNIPKVKWLLFLNPKHLIYVTSFFLKVTTHNLVSNFQN